MAKRLLAARLDPDAFAPGNRVAHARLRTGRRDHDRFAQSARGSNERRKARGIDPIVVRDQKFHGRRLHARCRAAILAARVSIDYPGGQDGAPYISGIQLSLRILRREISHDLLEARIASEGVPDGIETQDPVVHLTRDFAQDRQLFERLILLAAPGVGNGQMH